MSNCCYPVCCVHTKKEVVAQENFLDRTFRRMQLKKIGNKKKPVKVDADFSNLNFTSASLKFPIAGPIQIESDQLLGIRDTWYAIPHHEDFIRTYFRKLVEKKELRKPFLIPTEFESEEQLLELPIYKRHILLQHVGWQAIIDEVENPDKLRKVAAEIGLRHKRFSKIVLFQPWVWEYLTDCFMEALESHVPFEMPDGLKLCWRRMILWAMTILHYTFYFGEQYNSM